MNEEQCRNYRFYRAISYDCRQHAPVVVREKYETRGIGHITVYATVASDDWCGDFKQDEKRKT